MFEHLKLFGNFVNVIVGTLVIVYIYQVSRSYKYKYLKYLLRHTIIFNILVLLHLLSKYTDINLSENFFLKKIPGIIDILFYFLWTCFIMMAYYLLKINLSLREKNFTPREQKMISAVIVYLLFSPALALIITQLKINIVELHEDILSYNILFLLCSEIIILAGLRIYGRKCGDRHKKKMVNMFAYLYLSRYLLIFILMILMFLFTLQRPLGQLFGRCMLIYINLLPWFWLKFWFFKYARHLLSQDDMERVIAEIKKKYEITKREIEILDLILKGKSNREICDALYISIHTVKNHIYNLFQKLEVKNRYELMHFVTSSKENH